LSSISVTWPSDIDGEAAWAANVVYRLAQQSSVWMPHDESWSLLMEVTRTRTAGVLPARSLGADAVPTKTNAYPGPRFRVVEVRVVGDTVQISQQGRLIRTHAARHDRSKEHGAFATPSGRPRKPKVSQEGLAGVTELLEPICNAGTGT